MQIYRASIVFCFCVMLCHAQATKTDQALLNQARKKYDAPFNRNLQSFDCAVDFSWKEHFTETTRLGDEGTDEELEKFFQPIRNYVAVTRQHVTVSSGLTDDAIGKFPDGGMAEFLLEHATPVSFEQSPSGYKLAFNVQASDVEMVLAPDMRLQSATLKAPQSGYFETSSRLGSRGSF